MACCNFRLPALSVALLCGPIVMATTGVTPASETPDGEVARKPFVSTVDLNDPFDDNPKKTGGQPSQSNQKQPDSTNSQATTAITPIPAHLRRYSGEEILAFLEAFGNQPSENFYDYDKWAELDAKRLTAGGATAATLHDREILTCDDEDGKPIIRVTYKAVAQTTLGNMPVVLERFLHKTENGLKLNWPAMTGYTEQSLAAWRAGDTESLTVRGDLKISDSFRGRFAESSGTHYAIEIAEGYVGRSGTVIAYVAKQSNVGRRLYELLRDGDPHKCTVTISRATGADTPAIVTLNSTSWFFDGGPAVAESRASQPQHHIASDAPKKAEKPYKLSNGLRVTKDEITKHNEQIIARNLRELAGPPDPRNMFMLERNMGLFNSFFVEGVIPAYSGIWPIGRVDSVFHEAVNKVRQRPDAQQAISWALDDLGLGEMWLAYGREVKTYNEIWDECLLEFVRQEKVASPQQRSPQPQIAPRANDADFARRLTDLTPEDAHRLAGRSGDLVLDRLTELSNEAAVALARHKGYLRLGGLSVLSDAAAEALSRHEGGLVLSGLTTLSDEAAKSLGRHKGLLSLNGLTSLSDEAAMGLSQHTGGLSLSNLSVISKKALAALRTNPDISLPFELRR